MTPDSVWPHCQVSCLVIHVVYESDFGNERNSSDYLKKTFRSKDSSLEEAVGLARAINLKVIHSEAVTIRSVKPKTLFGKGQVERYKTLIEGLKISVVVVDGTLSPVQQRALEMAWKTKVIDRTGLILEIFGARARTHEGQLQVELASLSYQKSRLVRSWTHLERQRGGSGFLGGPGESQLEIDRRLIGERIDKIKRSLVNVRRTRSLHRQARARVPYPIIALVGYTNAGKSTLFNRLTQASVQAEDMLFATLDPTMRGLKLPSGKNIVISDTVGFISNLPTELVVAFRATLEEVIAADIIVHVRDISHPDTSAQKKDVEKVLSELVCQNDFDNKPIEVWNKIDLLDSEDGLNPVSSSTIKISALSGKGIVEFMALLDTTLRSRRQMVEIDLCIEDGKTLAWLYSHGEVRYRVDDATSSHLTVSFDHVNLSRLTNKFQHIKVRYRQPDID